MIGLHDYVLIADDFPQIGGCRAVVIEDGLPCAEFVRIQVWNPAAMMMEPRDCLAHREDLTVIGKYDAETDEVHES